MSIIRKDNLTMDELGLDDNPGLPMHDRLCIRATRWLFTKKNLIVLREKGCINTPENPDCIGWNGRGVSTMIECKSSKSDFMADKKKPFRKCDSYGVGMFRFYMMPLELAEELKLSVPHNFGVLGWEPGKGKVHVLRDAPAVGDFNISAERHLLISVLKYPDKMSGLKYGGYL